MDKADFLKLAPAYYELAVVFALQKTMGYLSEYSLRNAYTEVHDPADSRSIERLLVHEPLLQHAIQRLAKQNVVEALLDPFGPSQFREGPGLGAYLNAARADTSSPMHKSAASDDAEEWLIDEGRIVAVSIANLGPVAGRLRYRGRGQQAK